MCYEVEKCVFVLMIPACRRKNVECDGWMPVWRKALKLSMKMVEQVVEQVEDSGTGDGLSRYRLTNRVPCTSPAPFPLFGGGEGKKM